MKPQLPPELEVLLPQVILNHIYSFVPHLKKKKSPPPAYTLSPQAERDLRLLQAGAFKGKSEMYLRELDDFVLDRF
jgi:hypothetical protein